jgi:AraC-like DNA-binding protein
VNRYQILHATADLSVNRFDHPPHEMHQDPEREVAARWAIAFVRAGTFDVIVDGERHSLRAGSVFIPRPGLEFQCEHGDECPDDVCISVGFEDGAIGDAEHAWARAGWSARPRSTPRLSYVQRRLAGAVDTADAFEIERWALSSLASLRADSQDDRSRGHYSVRAADVDAVTAVCRAIEADPVIRRSIAERARGVGMTSTRLTHAFRRYVGLSPHQYVVRCRLAAAADLLNDGASVSDGCWRSGFENLSHFTRTWQRTFGIRASAWRSIPLRERRRKVQAMVNGTP